MGKKKAKKKAKPKKKAKAKKAKAKKAAAPKLSLESVNAKLDSALELLAAGNSDGEAYEAILKGA